jgi:hypothetical protein
MNVQRYYVGPGYGCPVTPGDGGPWVRYVDHVAALAEERAKNVPWTCGKDGTLNPYGFACIECIRLAAYEQGKADAEQSHAAALAEAQEHWRQIGYTAAYANALAAAAPRTLTADDRARIAQALRDNGFDSEGGPHSWRCFDKERYPEPCGCMDEVLDDIAAALDPVPYVAFQQGQEHLVHDGEAK